MPSGLASPNTTAGRRSTIDYRDPKTDIVDATIVRVLNTRP